MERYAAARDIETEHRGEYYAHLFVYDPQINTIEALGHPISNQSSITGPAIAKCP